MNELLRDSGAPSSSEPAPVFLSYSHRDERLKEQLITHLGVLGTASKIETWCDDRISAGASWKKEIELSIHHARVAVLLITAHFLNSDFILGQEIPRILQRRAEVGLKVIPVIGNHCVWNQHEWLAAMNVRPKNGTPVWRDEGRHADRELTGIVYEIAASLET